MDKIVFDICKAFKDKENQNKLIKAYRNNNSGYTGIIKQLIEKVIIDNTNNNKAYPEYYRIDYTGWERSGKNIDAKTKINIYDEWHFKYAIEHENNNNDWTYEVLKLSFIRSKVRIVIGYIDRGKISEEEEKRVLKEQVSKFIYEVADDEEFYVILMNRVYIEKDLDPFGMKIYQIKRKTVELIY